MYGTTLFAGINNCQSVMPFISIERSVVYRERFAGMYSPWAYSFAQVNKYRLGTSYLVLKLATMFYSYVRFVQNQTVLILTNNTFTNNLFQIEKVML